MDTENERDTHFKGAAEILWMQLHTLYLHDTGEKTYEQGDKQIIAQFLYDLIKHTTDYIFEQGALMMGSFEPEDIPDLVVPPQVEP